MPIITPGQARADGAGSVLVGAGEAAVNYPVPATVFVNLIYIGFLGLLISNIH